MSLVWSIPVMVYCAWLLWGPNGALRLPPKATRALTPPGDRKPRLRPENTPAGTCSICGSEDGQLEDGYHHLTCLEWLGYRPFIAHRDEAFTKAMEALASSGITVGRLRVLPPDFTDTYQNDHLIGKERK